MKGATLVSRIDHHFTACFNPRTHEGCDLLLLSSINLLGGFNPRTHEGCDSRRKKICTSDKVSIHAPMKGATYQFFHSPLYNYRFNPRTHEGCDCSGLRSRWRKSWGFNPRTHEGCDLLSISYYSILKCFNPRTHEGCDTLILTT